MKRTHVFYQLVYHFVWTTKNREPLISSSVEHLLLPYLAAKCRECRYELHAVNGTEDHLHVLVSLTPS